MAESYTEAALRHWTDGLLLERERRLSNADHLFGFAAECAIKVALTQVPGCQVGGRLHRRYLEHVDKLWSLLPLQGIQARFPGLVAVLKAGTPFDDWEIDQRYAADDEISEEAAARHRNAAKRLLGALGLSGVRKGT